MCAFNLIVSEFKKKAVVIVPGPTENGNFVDQISKHTNLIVGNFEEHCDGFMFPNVCFVLKVCVISLQ